MKSDNWFGREWDIENKKFKIENNNGSRELNLLISLN